MKPKLFELPKAPTSREEYIALLEMAIVMADELITQLDEIDTILLQPEQLAA